MKKAIYTCLLLLFTFSFQKVVLAEEPSPEQASSPSILGAVSQDDAGQFAEKKEEVKKAIEEKRAERLRSKIRAFQENSGKSITTTTTTQVRENPSDEEHHSQTVRTVTEEVRPNRVIVPTPAPAPRVVIEREREPIRTVTEVVRPSRIIVPAPAPHVIVEREPTFVTTVVRPESRTIVMVKHPSDTWFYRGQICRYVTTYKKRVRVNRHVTICKWRHGVRICYHPTKTYIYPVTTIVCHPRTRIL